MRKSKERRNMTYALVRYARLNIAYGCEDSIEIYKRIVGVCGSNRELALDLLAVRDLILTLKLENDTRTLKALHEIYFAPFVRTSKSQFGKSKMSYMILRFAYENNVDERTVYRSLQKAHMLWMKIRYT